MNGMENGRFRKYKTDDVIVEEGTKSGAMFKLVSGKAVVYRNYGKKNEFLVGVIAQNSFFGEVEFFNDTESSVSIVAIDEVCVLVVDRSEITEFVRGNTSNAIDIMMNMSKQIRMLEGHIMQLNDELDRVIDRMGKNIDVKQMQLKCKKELEAYGYHFR